MFSARANLTKTDVNKIIKNIEVTYPEGSEVVMTLIEKIRGEGIEEGILKGMEKGMERGIERGMEKGMELGAKQRNIEIAKKLAKINFPIEQIVDITGLTKKEVEKIAADPAFAEEILAELINQGYTGEKLLAEFKKINRQIRPAVEKIIAEADALAKAASENYVDRTDDIFGTDDTEVI